jgi:16S rRNA (adenine1518-N6/adenine1519-N6)-dimethyltransferase
VWSSLDDSPREIRALLDERGIALKKRWGQNFMVSRHARERVAGLSGITDGDTVWEVGPGLGGITAILIGFGGRVTVFEVDHGLIRVVRDRFGDQVRIVDGDAVKTIPAQEHGPQVVVGNLPYRSAAAIVSAILENPGIVAPVRRMVFTVQREMALRMVAGPGSPDYSAFSVLCSIASQVSLAGDLGGGNFYPPPEVRSSIVTMEPVVIGETDRRIASVAARSLFSQRRKKLSNNASVLAAALGCAADEVVEQIEAAGIKPSARAEEVPAADFVILGRLLAERGYSGRT